MDISISNNVLAVESTEASLLDMYIQDAASMLELSCCFYFAEDHASYTVLTVAQPRCQRGEARFF